MMQLILKINRSPTPISLPQPAPLPFKENNRAFQPYYHYTPTLRNINNHIYRIGDVMDCMLSLSVDSNPGRVKPKTIK